MIVLAAAATGAFAGAAVLAVRAADQASMRLRARSLSPGSASGWRGRSASGVVGLSPGRRSPAGRLVEAWRRPRRRLDGLRVTVEIIGRGVRSGASLVQAIEAAAGEVASPVGPDLRHVVHHAHHGDGLLAGLRWWSARRPDDDDVRMIAAALAVATTTGGGAAVAMEACGQVLADRVDLVGEISSLTSQAKASAVVVGAAPVVMVVLASVADPETARFLLTTAPGLALLLGGLGLDAAGAAWMAVILRRPR